MVRQKIAHCTIPLLLFAIGLWGRQASAQSIRLDEILPPDPFRIDLGVTLVLTRFGPDVAVSTTASAVIRNFDGISRTALPAINRQLACHRGSSFGAELAELAIGSANDSVVFRSTANIKECRFGSISGTILLTVPISAKTKDNRIVLLAGPASVQPSGVYAVGLFKVPDRYVVAASGKVTKRIQGIADTVNMVLNRQLFSPSLQKIAKAYRLALQSARLSLRGSDLALDATLYAQVPMSSVRPEVATTQF